MAFKKGQSGNPDGRAKRDSAPSTASVKIAWEALCAEKPWLIQEALERGLAGQRPLGFLELGARVQKEIGVQEVQQAQVTIVLNSSLDPQALKSSGEAIRVEVQAHPEPKALVGDVTLLEDLDGARK